MFVISEQKFMPVVSVGKFRFEVMQKNQNTCEIKENKCVFLLTAMQRNYLNHSLIENSIYSQEVVTQINRMP